MRQSHLLSEQSFLAVCLVLPGLFRFAMIQSFNSPPLFSMKRFLSSSLIVGAVSVTALLLGVVPDLQRDTLSQSFSSAAYAQAIPDAQVRSYAQTLLDIERLRQTANQQIQDVLGPQAQIPGDTCNALNIRSVQREIRQIVVDFCTQSSQAAGQNQLSTGDFNEITEALSSNPDLTNRIRQEMIRIQQTRSR